MKKNTKYIIFYVILAALLIFAVAQLFRQPASAQLEYSDVIKYFQKDQVESFTVNSGNGKLVLNLYPEKDGTIDYNGKTTQVSYSLASISIFYNDVSEYYKTNAHLHTYEFKPETASVWMALIPWVLIFVVVIALFAFYMRAAKNGGAPGGMTGFGKARVKTPQGEHDTVRFSDVAGADEEKAELEEIVEFLKDPQKFTRLGAKIPHGVLLVGPPGTGKTLLAKAVAGEAGVPFLSISGSDFVEMYVGVGASRVRDLFETARKAPASIIFIDEIDAVGRHRGAGLGGGHDEREQTLNQLLVEMDGFGTHDGIIVMAATNRPDILDPALLRPGRFDRQITVNVPDLDGREAILKVHARKKPLDPSVDLRAIASSTVGFTGADLANLLNEAALLAARRGKTLIGMDDLNDAYFKVVMGPQKKSMHMNEREKKNTAYHEAGHALVSYYLGLDPVRHITIVPSGRALGLTLTVPEEDKYSYFKDELKKQISMLLGGRAAEHVIFGDVSGGASNDIERATKIARNMVMKLGMSDTLGPINYGGEQGEVFLGRDFSNAQDYSDVTASKIDEEVHKLMDDGYKRACSLLEEHLDKLHFVAGYLLDHESMDGDQFKVAMEKDDVTTADLEAIAAEKKRKSDEANAERARRDAEEKAKREREAKEAAERMRQANGPIAFSDETGNNNPFFGGNRPDDGKRSDADGKSDAEDNADGHGSSQDGGSNNTSGENKE